MSSLSGGADSPVSTPSPAGESPRSRSVTNAAAAFTSSARFSSRSAPSRSAL